MDINIYYILGALLVVYLLISMFNKKTARKRKSRKFMEGYERREKPSRKEGNNNDRTDS